jgi:hypothetical protein
MIEGISTGLAVVTLVMFLDAGYDISSLSMLSSC